MKIQIGRNKAGIESLKFGIQITLTKRLSFAIGFYKPIYFNEFEKSLKKARKKVEE